MSKIRLKFLAKYNTETNKLTIEILEQSPEITNRSNTSREIEIIAVKDKFSVRTVGEPQITKNVFFLRGAMDHLDNQIASEFFEREKQAEEYLNKIEGAMLNSGFTRALSNKDREGVYIYVK